MINYWLLIAILTKLTIKTIIMIMTSHGGLVLDMIFFAIGYPPVH